PLARRRWIPTILRVAMCRRTMTARSVCMKSRHGTSCRLIVLGGLSLALGCGKGGLETAPAPPPPAVKVVHPHRRDIVRSVTLPGNGRAWQEATLFGKVTGYLKTITVDKGDEVAAGTLIADIEVPELLADLVKSQAEVNVAAIDYRRVAEARKKAPDLVIPQ